MTVLLQDSKSSRLQAGKREKVWKVIRGLPTGFIFDEVAMLAEEQKAGTYLIQLYHAGYIRQAGKRKEGDGRKKVVWRLVKNTGPKAPVPCRCLYDPNIDKAQVEAKAKAKVKAKEDKTSTSTSTLTLTSQ